MDRSAHPETLFHLQPRDDTTLAVLHHQDNAHFVSTSVKGKPALEIGYHVSSRPRGGRVIARLGREADLILPAKNIAQVHLAFEVHPTSHAILLCVSAEKIDSVRVEPGGFRPDGNFRQLVLVWGKQYYISIGEDARPYIFDVLWRLDLPSPTGAIDNGFQAAQGRAVNPRWLKTEDDNDSDIRSWYNTRLQTKTVNRVRDAQLGEKLGAGAYGKVYKSIDLDSGHFVAVKVVGPKSDRERMNLHREIKCLQTLKHPHIIEFFGHRQEDLDKGEQDAVRIFMPLQAGSVNDLAPLPEEKEKSIIVPLLGQIFSALDYLSSQNLCHRDIKPANILYDVKNGNYSFQLADFGLANHQRLAETVCGTRIFAAPELHPDYGLGQYRQTPKMDVWSLFVTIVSLIGRAKFDEEKLAACAYSEILAFVRDAAANVLPELQAMACENPELRASAAQMLVMYFDGKGLTTRLSNVRPIPEIPVSVEAGTQPGTKVGRVAPRPGQPTPGRQPTIAFKPPSASRGLCQDRESPSSPVAAPRPERQKAPPAVALPTPPPPPTPAGPWTRTEDGQPRPRRWVNTNRVVKAKTPTVRQRERQSRMPGHFGSQDLEF